MSTSCGSDPGERLAAYVAGELDPGEREDVAAHVSSCEWCGRRLAELEGAWLALDVPLRGQGLESRRARRLVERLGDATVHRGGARDERRHRRAVRRSSLALAAAVVLGFVGGWWAAPAGDDVSTELVHRVHETEDALFVARLADPDALSRLAAIGELAARTDRGRPVEPDPRVVEALLEALATDPNVNVRLAVVEALTSRLADPDVALRAARLVEADASVLVQVALVERFLALRDASLRSTVLEEIGQANLAPEARSRVEAADGGRT